MSELPKPPASGLHSHDREGCRYNAFTRRYSCEPSEQASVGPMEAWIIEARPRPATFDILRKAAAKHDAQAAAQARQIAALEAYLRKRQQQWHEEFHGFEGEKEDCDEGYCEEVNQLIARAALEEPQGEKSQAKS